MADLIGRRLGQNNKWFFNPSKSIAGTSAFFISSLVTSFGLISWLSYTGSLTVPLLDASDLFTRLALICGFSSLVELFPVGDDNWNVPIAAAVMTSLLL